LRRLLAARTFSLTLLVPVALPVPSQPATQTPSDPKTQTVYVTRTGKNTIETDAGISRRANCDQLERCQGKGHTACKVCQPPE